MSQVEGINVQLYDPPLLSNVDDVDAHHHPIIAPTGSPVGELELRDYQVLCVHVRA